MNPGNSHQHILGTLLLSADGAEVERGVRSRTGSTGGLTGSLQRPAAGPCLEEFHSGELNSVAKLIGFRRGHSSHAAMHGSRRPTQAQRSPSSPTPRQPPPLPPLPDRCRHLRWSGARHGVSHRSCNIIGIIRVQGRAEDTPAMRIYPVPSTGGLCHEGSSLGGRGGEASARPAQPLHF